MTWHPAFAAAAEAAAHRLGPSHLRQLTERLEAGQSDEVVAEAVPVPGFSEAVAPLLAARRTDGVSFVKAAAYLHGLAAGRQQGAAAIQVESVWSGPKTHPVPVRATAQVLVGLVGEARQELLLMTYSAREHPPLRAALTAALTRGVIISVVVETLQGAAGALVGVEPAAAFAGLAGLQIWHWPIDQRHEEHARMHAKVAVADRRVMLVSSANLTQSGADRNIEAGLLVRGGSAPQRTAEHFAELRSRGVLTRLAG